MKSRVGTGEGTARKSVLCGDEWTLWDGRAYGSIRAQFLLKLLVSLGGSYASLDKSSFVLGNELWDEHFESLLALVKANIIDIREEGKYDIACAQQPRPHSPTGDLGPGLVQLTSTSHMSVRTWMHIKQFLGNAMHILSLHA